MDIQQFRDIVSNNEHKLRHIQAVWLCLNFVEKNPELASQIGCLWNSDSTFLMNLLIYSLFNNKKRWAVIKGLRCHNFISNRASKQIRLAVPLKFNFSHLPSQSNWIQYKSKGFTKNTTESEAKNWKFYSTSHRLARTIVNE